MNYIAALPPREAGHCRRRRQGLTHEGVAEPGMVGPPAPPGRPDRIGGGDNGRRHHAENRLRRTAPTPPRAGMFFAVNLDVMEKRHTTDTLRKMTVPRRGLVLAVLLLAGAPLGAEAPQWHPHENIRMTAEHFAAERAGTRDDDGVSARAGRLDARLRLRNCQEPLEAFLPPGRELRSSTTIGVRCPGPVQWQVFVPVHMEVSRPVVVLTNSVRRGQALEAEDLELRERDTASLHRGYLESIDEALGMQLRRNLTPGTVLRPGHLDMQRLIERGQNVTLRANNSSVQVSMGGKALENGGPGERIAVENRSSGRELEGVVVDGHTVEIRY